MLFYSLSDRLQPTETEQRLGIHSSRCQRVRPMAAARYARTKTTCKGAAVCMALCLQTTVKDRRLERPLRNLKRQTRFVRTRCTGLWPTGKSFLRETTASATQTCKAKPDLVQRSGFRWLLRKQQPEGKDACPLPPRRDTLKYFGGLHRPQ